MNKPDEDDEPLARALRATQAALHEAPEALVQRTIALFQARRPAPKQRLAALLRFDSAGASPLAFGMRSSGAAMRQLLYSLEGRDIDLRVAPAAAAGQFTLSGQILGPDTSGTVLAVRGDGSDVTEERAAALDALGEFRIAPLQAGTWHLTLELGDCAIDLPPLHIPLPAASA